MFGLTHLKAGFLVVTGGLTGGESQALVEVLDLSEDPERASWKAIPPMCNPRCWHCTVAYRPDALIVAGGLLVWQSSTGLNRTSQNGVEILKYSPEDGWWQWSVVINSQSPVNLRGLLYYHGSLMTLSKSRFGVLYMHSCNWYL